MKNSPGCHGENGILIAVKQDNVRREGGWKMELLKNGTFVQSIRNRGESGACPEGCIIFRGKG